MARRKEKGNNWKSVPKFGAWDAASSNTNYSMAFAAAREKRKQHKKGIILPHSIGSERELIASRKSNNGHQPALLKSKKSFRRYFACCLGA